MSIAEVVAVGFGAVGTVTGVVALVMQYMQVWRGPEVLLDYEAPLGDEEYGRLTVEVVNKSTTPLSVKDSGVQLQGSHTWDKAPFPWVFGEEAPAGLPGHSVVHRVEAPSHCTINPLGSRRSRLRADNLTIDRGIYGVAVSETHLVMMRPYCVTARNKLIVGSPLRFDARRKRPASEIEE